MPNDDQSHSSSSSLDSVTTALEDHTTSLAMRPTKINILPRTSSSRYSALDTSAPSTGRKLGWRGIGIVLGIFVAAVWIINPRQQYQQYKESDVSEKPYEDSQTEYTGVADPPKHHRPPPPPPVHHEATVEEDEDAAAASDKPITLTESPKSPETDPDPMKTVHCLAPFKKTLPIVQYALMLDAGSTGSRIHVYKFHNCFASPTLEYEVFKMTQPGLSSFSTRPLDAAKSLDVLMAEAVRVVPKQLQGCTKVAVKATAGLRLLGKDVSEAILTAVRQRLTSQYKFPLAGTDAVTIMDGKDEGVYAWITANYLLGAIGGAAKSTRPTYAVLDLGGASTQIVFEPTFSQAGHKGATTTTTALEEGDHKYVLTFSGKTYTLYQHSYLGYGLMRARRSVNNLVGFMWDFRLDGSANALTGPGTIGGGKADSIQAAEPSVPNPCFAKGTKKRITLDGGKWATGYNVSMTGEDVGSFDHCNRVVELVMAKDAVCTVKPCSFNGVYQPNILDTFPAGGILALSYFYDRIFPLLPFGSSKKSSSHSLPISDISTIADQVCAGPDSWEKHWGATSDYARSFSAEGSKMSPAEASKEILAELHGRPEYCLDLTFMHGLLRLGYEFGSERQVRVEKKVDDVELGWCLGATIALLLGVEGDGLKCIA